MSLGARVNSRGIYKFEGMRTEENMQVKDTLHIYLPPEVWAVVIHYTPLESLRTWTQVCAATRQEALRRCRYCAIMPYVDVGKLPLDFFSSDFTYTIYATTIESSLASSLQRRSAPLAQVAAAVAYHRLRPQWNHCLNARVGHNKHLDIIRLCGATKSLYGVASDLSHLRALITPGQPRWLNTLAMSIVIELTPHAGRRMWSQVCAATRRYCLDRKYHLMFAPPPHRYQLMAHNVIKVTTHFARWGPYPLAHCLCVYAWYFETGNNDVKLTMNIDAAAKDKKIVKLFLAAMSNTRKVGQTDLVHGDEAMQIYNPHI